MHLQTENSHFKYTQLVWMFIKKSLFKNRNIHHKNLKVIYESNDITYSSMVSVCQRHLRFLMTEIYKSISQTNPEFYVILFTHKDMPYSLRNDLYPKTHSIYYGINASHMGVLSYGIIFLL